MTLKIFDLKVRFWITPALGRPFSAKNWKKTNLCAKTRKTLNFRVSTFSLPLGYRAYLHSRPEGPSLRMGWMDRMGRNIKSFLQISLYFVSIYKIYTSTYNQSRHSTEFSLLVYYTVILERFLSFLCKIDQFCSFGILWGEIGILYLLLCNILYLYLSI